MRVAVVDPEASDGLAVAAEELGAALSHLPGAEAKAGQVALEPLRDTYHDHQMRSGVIAAAGAAIGILLLACANVANLLARGLRRSREMAVRTSLGARRGQLAFSSGAFRPPTSASPSGWRCGSTRTCCG